MRASVRPFALERLRFKRAAKYVPGVKWFGESWEAPVNHTNERAEIPETRHCAECEKEIRRGDRGLLLPYYGPPEGIRDMVYHLDCFLRCIGVA